MYNPSYICNADILLKLYALTLTRYDVFVIIILRNFYDC